MYRLAVLSCRVMEILGHTVGVRVTSLFFFSKGDKRSFYPRPVLWPLEKIFLGQKRVSAREQGVPEDALDKHGGTEGRVPH